MPPTETTELKRQKIYLSQRSQRPQSYYNFYLAMN